MSFLVLVDLLALLPLSDLPTLLDDDSLSVGAFRVSGLAL